LVSKNIIILLKIFGRLYFIVKFSTLLHIIQGPCGSCTSAYFISIRQNFPSFLSPSKYSQNCFVIRRRSVRKTIRENSCCLPSVPSAFSKDKSTSQHNRQLNTSRQNFATRFQILRKNNDKLKCLNCQDDTNICQKK
jgi:hypothetical protein